jgi:two-component system, LytTR family, response regulator
MEPIRTLIVDDEMLARRRIRNLLRGRDDFEIVAECANGSEAVSAIERHAPDLVFLDMQMPDLDGFGVMKQVRGKTPVTVFVTAYEHYAVQAFEFHALDYLLKPFDDERFEKTLDWVRTQMQRERLEGCTRQLLALLEPAHAAASAAPPARLMLKSPGRVQFIHGDEIDWIKAEGYYARLHLGDKSHLMRESLTRLETQLDPHRFQRIHRSIIVNLDRIRELQPQSHGDGLVLLADGTKLRWSRSYRDKLQQSLKSKVSGTE